MATLPPRLSPSGWSEGKPRVVRSIMPSASVHIKGMQPVPGEAQPTARLVSSIPRVLELVVPGSKPMSIGV